jgi:hypothetical protein
LGLGKLFVAVFTKLYEVLVTCQVVDKNKFFAAAGINLTNLKYLQLPNAPFGY